MRFLDLLNEKSIPEWARCYYDYESCKMVINHAKKVLLILEKMKDFKKVIILPQTNVNNTLESSDEALKN